MRVKICGITKLDDAYAAIDAGADALGFVFYEKSPRYIEPRAAKELIAKLPPFVERVALFVNREAAEIDEICSFCAASLAQIHFDAPNSLYEKLKIKSVRVVRAQNKNDVSLFKDEYRLVDSFTESYGGEGKRLNLEWFKEMDLSKITLAGGLTVQNITELKGLGFYGVDVSSGVESQKGVKDKELIRRFIRAAKEL